MTDEEIADVTRSWWSAWIEPETSIARATRARLRRAHDWQEAMLEPAAVILAMRLGVTGHERRLTMALNLATLLAHVKKDASRPLMRELGYEKPPTEKDKGDPPRLARVRFTRLLRSTPEELPLALIRLVRLAGGEANVGELGSAMMRWAHEARREKQRKDWAFAYYHSTPDEAERIPA